MDAEFLDRISSLSPKRLALLAAQLKEQVDEAARLAREPLAIVGLGCRFPGGAADPGAYWRLLDEGRDGIVEVPAERWDIDALYAPDPDTPGRMSARAGGFLEHATEFDAAFFGITPREALTLDPQQRLLLEVTWEALEDAGLAPAKLHGSATGVFVGICNSDHFQRVLGHGLEDIDAYLASGNAHSTASGRISYTLGLQGPSLAVDTACSSSLVALHLACQSLRRGETSLAIAAGVNLMCSPETTIALSKAHMLAPDGRCKTFDAKADGFSRGEGCGVLVLERLSDAVAAEHRILAVIRGSAVNQDGRSGGLTVPNGPAQQAVIRAALADAGVEPAAIDYVEAHGTGTSLGDPIEIKALATALAPGRAADQPVLVGSVKTNIGHLESAAGIAGVMKVVLALAHERIPKHLHFHEPSPHIDWTSHPVAVTAEARAWPRSERRRLAGVSSFGFSGTNAHVVLEEPPVSSEATSAERPVYVLPLSARTPAALGELANRCEGALDAPGARLADAMLTAGAGRSHFSERLAVVASNVADARAALAAAKAGTAHPGLRRGTAPSAAPVEVVFLFTGQGSQYPGMGRFLYEHEPVFRDVIDRSSQILGPDARGRTLESVLAPGPAEGAPIHETAWTQPALFALEYGITELWRSWGVEPAAVIGHSVGEYVAACVAGVFTLEEGLRLIAERGRILQALPPGGAMAAVFAPHAEVAALVAPMADRLAVAAVNAPDSVVVSGSSDAVDRLLAELARRNVQGQRLFVSFAAHSPLVEPAMAAMEACARQVTMKPPKIPVAWNLTGGEPLPGGAPDAAYFRRHLREPVHFAEGIASLAPHRVFLEVGPHPVLTALAQRNLTSDDKRFVSSLRRGMKDADELAASLAELYVNGARIDFAGVARSFGGRRTAWPSYPFERRQYWLPAPSAEQRARSAAADPPGALPGRRLPTAAPIFELNLALETVSSLAEHRVLGQVLVAAPVFVEIAHAAAAKLAGAAPRALTHFAIHEALVLGERPHALQTQLTAAPDGAFDFSIHGRDPDADDWRLHASGRLVRLAGDGPKPDAPPLARLETSLSEPASSDAFYARLTGLGVTLGGAFRALTEVRTGDGEVLAKAVLPAAHASERFVCAHPGLLDAALQSLGMAVATRSQSDDIYLFSELERLELLRPLPAAIVCHARLRPSSEARPAAWYGDVTLRSASGEVLGTLTGVCLRRASRAGLARLVREQGASGPFYAVEWEPVPSVLAAAPALVDPAQYGGEVRARFDELAREHELAIYDELLPELDRLSAEYLCMALKELGFQDVPGRVFEASAETRALGVAPRHTRLFARALVILTEEGVLRARGAGAFEVTRAFGPPRIDPSSPRLEAQGEVSVLRRAGAELARVLRGERDPVDVLFPEGNFAEARKIYVESPFARTYNTALAEALGKAVARVPAGARLRVLEIGAGTGGTTTYVLPALPAERTDYTFTDVSPAFLERAAAQFSRYGFVSRALLDIGKDPSRQGFQSGAYDVVIAANVLHATSNLRQVVAHVRQLLAPGGLLLLLEGTAPERWVDLTFGLTEGWWSFTDTDLRPDYALIDRNAWAKLLGEHGFTSVHAIPEGTNQDRRAAQQALIVARAPARPRSYLVVGPSAGLGPRLVERLANKGDRAVLVAPEAVPETLEPDTEVVYLGALELAAAAHGDLGAVARSETLACELPLRWLARVAKAAGRAWLVTQGAERVAGDSVQAPEWQAPLWGLGRGFAVEAPLALGAVIDLPPSGTPAELADALLGELDTRERVPDGEDQIALRDGRRFGARLRSKAAPPRAELALRPDATYLVTGGFGGLGLVVARFLAEHGAKCIALAGRRPDTRAEGVRQLDALGARVIPLALDVGDEAALDALAARFASAELPPLRGIVHAAADLNSAPVTELGAEAISRMLRPKLRGSVLLERLARARELDFLVLFSSTTALLGATGLAHYAAANAFLDALAPSARAHGVPALSIDWGTWETMRLASKESQASFLEGGLLPLPTDEALDALARLVRTSEAQAVVANIDWSRLKPLYEAKRARRFLAHLGGEAAPAAETASANAPVAALPARLAAALPGARRELLLDFVLGEVSTVLRVPSDQPIPLDSGLFELGMDSLMSVELRKRLESGAGRPLPSTLTFNYPSVNALAGFLEVELADVQAPASEPKPPPEPVVPAAAPATSDDLDLLDEDELAARLRARLERTR